MFRPDSNRDRTDYSGILMPPDGYRLDRAVGTTYSLDLEALTAVAICLGLSEETDSKLMQNPIGMLNALQKVSDKIVLFCEAGQIKVPTKPTALSILLEKMVVEVALPKDRQLGRYPSFHPKTWVLAYVNADGDKKYRFVVMSRSYVDETGDAHEKYNFTPMNMEGKEGLYCLGFFETKSHNGKDVNQMRIENIAGCELLKKEESVDDVLVVYCAKHPAHKFTTVVGWYKHATVFRHYQEAVFAPEDIQYYNAIANSSDCVLLPAGIRSRKVQWEVPRKSNGWAYGFGRANVWYASEEDSRLQDYLTRLVKQIDEYDGENWIDKYAK